MEDFAKIYSFLLMIILFGPNLLFVGVLVLIGRISALIGLKMNNEQYYVKEQGSRIEWKGQRLSESKERHLHG